ncbi:hypothetical protein F4811DRAFT_559548 [Daldinia bambusicola]|nr:hypothetical protein F4811DRAFT_559548 [Daldinia bambusicola]
MAANAAEWTITSLSRTCDAADTVCDWTFGINDGSGAAATTDVKYTVKAAGGKPASQAPGGPVTVGPYTITSQWSDQFGADKGFTTFAVVDNAKRLIAYPGYDDAAVKDGKTVSPDRSYPVQNLP